MFRRWAQEHERGFLTTFVLLVLVALAAMSVAAAREGHAVEIGAAWLGGFAVTAAVMYARHRNGRLILRRAEDRERQREVNERSLGYTPAIMAGLIALGVIGGLAQDLAFAFLGGIFTAFGPVLLWIAFALRPDQHPGEDLRR